MEALRQLPVHFCHSLSENALSLDEAACCWSSRYEKKTKKIAELHWQLLLHNCVKFASMTQGAWKILKVGILFTNFQNFFCNFEAYIGCSLHSMQVNFRLMKNHYQAPLDKWYFYFKISIRSEGLLLEFGIGVALLIPTDTHQIMTLVMHGTLPQTPRMCTWCYLCNKMYTFYIAVGNLWVI